MCKNLEIWNKVKQVPPELLKPIGFGKLKGKSDINPQWRLMAMTQAFGQVGHGWTYRIVRTWSEPNPTIGSAMCFAEVAVKTKVNGEWGEEFSGIGGSEIIEHNKNGLQSNDDGYKMAVTDALSVAFKCVGVASDIYLGNYDGSKYQRTTEQAFIEVINQSQFDTLIGIINNLSDDKRNFAQSEMQRCGIVLKNLSASDYQVWYDFLKSLEV